jgi:hypothetical protein
MSDWRVVHFSTGYTGGAAIAAKSLDRALKCKGVDSEIFFLSSLSRSSIDVKFLKRSLSEKLISKTYTLFSSIISRKVLFTTHSSKLSSLDQLINKFDPNSTILHFHNWFNMGNSSQFNEIASRGYKLVFTLHDERFYTGGCHYALKCEKFQSNCDGCPLIPEIFSFTPKNTLQKTYEDMMKTEATFIAPSKWIQNRALSSKVLKDAKIVHIPNYISSPEKFHAPTELTENTHSIIVLGIGSINPFDPIKGGELVKEILKNQSGSRFKVVFLKDFEDSELFWRQIDYLLVPSQIDNSPNVIHESKFRGTPIIAMPVGGITELMGELDIQLKNSSYDSFIQAIDEAQKNESEEIRGAIRAEMEDYRQNSIKLHIEEYKDLLIK